MCQETPPSHPLIRNRVPLPLLRLLVVLVLAGSTIFMYGGIATLIPARDGFTNWLGRPVVNDFVVFYGGAVLAGRGDAATVYDPEALQDALRERLPVEPPAMGWFYPPTYLLLLLPLGLLGYLPALWVWSVACTGALMAAVRGLVNHWHAPLFVPLSPLVVDSMANGQNGALSAALLGAGLALTVRHPVLAGIAFGLLSYKPHLALVVPFCLLAGRHFRALGVMLATALGFIVLSLLCFGIEPWLAFPDGIARQGGEVFVQVPDNWPRMPTLLTLARQLGGGAVWIWSVQVVGAVTAAVVAAWVWRKSMEPVARVLAVTAATLLATPYAWDYDTAILVLPLALLIWQGWQQGFSWGLVAVVTGLWAIGPMIKLLSAAAGFQLGPLLWLGLLGYAAYLAKQARGWGAGNESGNV